MPGSEDRAAGVDAWMMGVLLLVATIGEESGGGGDGSPDETLAAIPGDVLRAFCWIVLVCLTTRVGACGCGSDSLLLSPSAATCFCCACICLAFGLWQFSQNRC
ncbi:hypothetical protein QAD02_020677 [Eretmocerus hayati]|uniref:Uncharacterized protein n=1 Tax=Eretmocerus hayati TaxID=131215 RepID=A0ACC2PNJ3_9HYME|nr:hypothetical protein QAD02_020677 [Eretmocerus hayati]